MIDIEITQEKDTRDHSDITVIRIKTEITNFKKALNNMRDIGAFYSRFKKGFITKAPITTEQIEKALIDCI